MSSRKKVDSRIHTLIKNSVSLKHRSLFVVVGDHGRDQVVILHNMMMSRPIDEARTYKARNSVLWCYKKELGFSSHRKKRMKQLQKKIKNGTLEIKEGDSFELFIASTDISYRYYKDSHRILGNTYGMCVLQDFEALTPNLLARTVETVEGGGLVVILLRTMTSLRQLCTMTMDVHARYRTQAHSQISPRFNERFLLSLSQCPHCLVIDDKLNILPISSHMLTITPVTPKVMDEDAPLSELDALKNSLADTQPVGHLVKCCRTMDQAKALLKFIEAISEQTLRSTVAMTASRGRGKSATLGLAIGAAVVFGYSNIFVTSPSPENLQALFEFLFKAFDSADYKEHEHYEIIKSTHSDFNNAVVRVNIFHQHRQTVQYIHPGDGHKLAQAELVCIDEAAAIPLPLVKQLLGPYLVFMASTINGYEGTGRSLSLKLIQGLRQESVSGGGRVLREVSLEDPIRYASHDPVEAWLHQLLCLDAGHISGRTGGCPDPQECQLYYVNRDTLFCSHKASESFLQSIMSLYVSSHYKNSPNDLQLLSDAPAHRIFVLLGPVSIATTALPEVLCVLQVCLEGAINQEAVSKYLHRGKSPYGDMIPWNITQQFDDDEFATLSGVRVVRIATHPDFQRMGYGTRCMELLLDYYSGKFTSLLDESKTASTPASGEGDDGGDLLHEVISPRTSLPPLLTELSERRPEQVEWVGVSFGLTRDLLRFWASRKINFVPVYLRQTKNDLTGEHSCIMVRALVQQCDWLDYYYKGFRSRFLYLLSYQFNVLPSDLAHLLIKCGGGRDNDTMVTNQKVTEMFSKCDLRRLRRYMNNMADHHLITDLIPNMARLYFTHKVTFKLTSLQSRILLGMGLQHKTFDTLKLDLDPRGKGGTMTAGSLLGQFRDSIRKFSKMFDSLLECEVAKGTKDMPVQPQKGVSAAAQEELLKSSPALSQYAVSGREEEWAGALGGSVVEPSIVSLKSKLVGKRKSRPTERGGEGVKHTPNTKRTKKFK